MENFQKRLDEIIDKISYLETRRIKMGNFLKEINDSFRIGPNEEIPDAKIINKVPAREFKRMKVLGIDGGIVKHSYHGLDIMLMRSVGVNFEYVDGKLGNVDYYPNSNPLPNPKIIFDSFSDVELNSCYNFERQIMEILAAIESMKKFSPDITLLDGSIIPHYVPTPDNPVLKEYYKNLIDTYKAMFEISREKNIILAGIIEDSRGIKFCDIVNRRILSQVKLDIAKELKLILEKTKDTNLLYYALERGERSCVFNYSQNPMVHPVLKEFESMNNFFYSFYLKTVDFDRPLRVDLLCFKDVLEVVDELSSVLMQISGHSGYGMPSVLIEADQRARLSEKDLEMFYSDLIVRMGNVSTLFKMRREMRPF
ncbi:MAG: DNA double-strand break repair nuclease NurA [Candidatus Aenigmarchaeota archaeon]|nr:DNA double-strand break repair nuclease NurA [Candidatus Aenigmarchaeota archaeon]